MTNHHKKHYLGGYYLAKLAPVNFGSYSNAMIYTCSNCINDHLVDVWSYTWATGNDERAVEAREIFQLSEKQIGLIRNWVDEKHNESKLGWINVFTLSTLTRQWNASKDSFPI